MRGCGCCWTEARCFVRTVRRLRYKQRPRKRNVFIQTADIRCGSFCCCFLSIDSTSNFQHFWPNIFRSASVVIKSGFNCFHEILLVLWLSATVFGVTHTQSNSENINIGAYAFKWYNHPWLMCLFPQIVRIRLVTVHQTREMTKLATTGLSSSQMKLLNTSNVLWPQCLKW